MSVDDTRRYDDREVGLILKRVAELHEQQGSHSEPHSLSRREIEDVVAELGISPTLVDRAVAELGVADIRNRPVWWLGGKTELMFEQVVDGKVDDATVTRMIEVLRRYFADPGSLETDGATRLWTTNSQARHLHFTVVEHEDSTTVRLEERMPVDARTTVAGPTFMGGFAAFMGSLPLKVLLGKTAVLLSMGPLAATGAAAGWMVGRALWKRRSQRREDELRAAFTEILGHHRRRALPPAADSDGRPT